MLPWKRLRYTKNRSKFWIEWCFRKLRQMPIFCHKWLALDRLSISFFNWWSLTLPKWVNYFSLFFCLFFLMNKCIQKNSLNENRQLIQFWNTFFLKHILLLSSVGFLPIDMSSNDVRESAHYQDFHSRDSTKNGMHS